MTVHTRTLSITSGKGGVGKTSIVTNMGLNLASGGKKVLILDGDLGMGNVDIMFGFRSRKSIHDLLEGDCEIGDVLKEVRPGLFVLPAGSGIYELQNLNQFQKRTLLDQVASLGTQFDYMIVDTAPGIDDNVLYLNAAVSEIHVVVTPDPSSLADSYALIKVLNKFHKETRFNIICNNVKDETEGLLLYKRLSDVTSKFLCVSLDYKGCIVTDPLLARSTKVQQLVVESAPQSPSSLNFRQLSKKIAASNNLEANKGGLQFFWEQLFAVA